MRKAALLAVMLTATAFAAVAAETESQKTVAGFRGLLIVTPDKDWEKKWNTSPEAIPYVSGASTVRKGGELFILTMFSNPQLDASGAASVSMDIDVTRPDGSSSSRAENAACVRGKLNGPPDNLYLCGQVVGFVGEPADPVGTWSVRVVLQDDVRKVSMTLATSFALVADEQTAQPTTVDIQGAGEWKRSPHMRAYYDETLATFKSGTDIDVDAYEARSFAIFREFARAQRMNEEAMLDHLKLIPRQVVGIVKENPAVLYSYDAFWAALAGPD